MTESQIKKIVRTQLEKENYLVWYPPVSRFAPKFSYCVDKVSAKDIFGIFDCMGLKDSEIRYIQYTSLSNMSARKKKILKFFEDYDVFVPCEVWGIRDDKTYKIDYI